MGLRQLGYIIATGALGFCAAIGHAAAQTPKYIVTLGPMEVFNGVAHSIDTDYITLSVHGPGGYKSTQTSGPNKLHKKDRTDWKLSAAPVSVPSIGEAALTVTWAAANTGTPDTQKVAKAMSDAAEQIGQQSDNPYTVVISTVVGEVAGHFLADCDTPLFGDKVVLSGTQLAAGLTEAPWSAAGAPNTWHAVFDYPSITSRCDTGKYNLEVFIKRVDAPASGPAVNTPQASTPGGRADFMKRYALGYSENTWHVIVGSFSSEAGAKARVTVLNQKYPTMYFQETQSNARQAGKSKDQWMVTLGSGIGKSNADNLLKLARSKPDFSDAYEYCWGIGPSDPDHKCQP